MKTSTKKLLLASLLTGTLAIYPNITFADEIDDLVDESTLSDNKIEVGEDYAEVNGLRGTYGNGQWSVAGRSGTYTWPSGNIFRIHGGNSSSQTVGYNLISITGNTFNLLFDGSTYYGNLIGNQIILNNVNLSFDNEGSAPYYIGTVDGNLLRINGGSFSNFYSSLPDVTATNNTVEIDGGADISNAYLFGGLLGDVDNASGNTLNINGVGYTARNIYDFDNLNFNLPASTKNGDIALTLTGGSTDISNRSINAVIAGGTNLTTGDKVTLLANNNGLNTSNLSMGSRFAEGVTLTYDTEMNASSNGIELTLGAPHVEEQTRSLNQGSLVSSGEINRNTQRMIDVLPVEDFEPFSAENNDGDSSDESNSTSNMVMLSNSFGFFAEAGGGRIKTKTGSGSYVKSRGNSFNFGLPRTFSGSEGESFLLIPVFDYGKSSYDSYLSDGTHGHGDSKFFLGGLFVRKMYKSGLYWEGSFRGGKSDLTFSSNDFISGGQRVNVGYDDSTPAFAGHIRVGKLKRLNKNNLMHIYGSYAHSHLNGMRTRISTGERYNFDSVDSGTFLLGYRLTTRTSRISNFYTGLALQYQINGSTSATYRGYKTAKAQTKGATGILELGWLIRPNRTNPWMLNMNATAYFGHQQGVTATFKIQKHF